MWLCRLFSLNYNGKFTLFSQCNTKRVCKSVMTVNQLAGGGPKHPNKLDFSPSLKPYQCPAAMWGAHTYRCWESKPLLDLCSGLCECNQPEKQPLPRCSPPAKTARLSARRMNRATVHECRPASARLNVVLHCLWQTQRCIERCRTLMTSVGCAPLSVISLSTVGCYSINMCKYPHATYLTNQMERWLLH